MAVQVPSSVAASHVSAETSQLRQLDILGWIIEILKYFLLITLAVSFMLPFYWMASSALKDDSQVFTVPPIWIPIPAHWNNFWDAWTIQNFNLFLVNTVVRYAIPATIGAVLSSAIVAYGFSRVRWPGRDLLFSLCLATMMIPGQVRLVPLFITFRRLGWLNSFKPLVIPAFFGNAYFIFLLRQFFLTIPQELSDAARIDGASEFGILFRIILPLARPALAVVALFQFMWAWNDYFGPLVYISKRSHWTIALGIAKLRSAIYEVGYSRLEYPYLMAVSAIVTVPILLTFFFAQRTFIEGISLTGLKG